MKFKLPSTPLLSRAVMTTHTAFYLSIMGPLFFWKGIDETDVHCVFGIVGLQVWRDSLIKSLSRDHMHLSSQSVWKERRGPWLEWQPVQGLCDRRGCVSSDPITHEGRQLCLGVLSRNPATLPNASPGHRAPVKSLLEASVGKRQMAPRKGWKGMRSRVWVSTVSVYRARRVHLSPWGHGGTFAVLRETGEKAVRVTCRSSSWVEFTCFELVSPGHRILTCWWYLILRLQSLHRPVIFT